MLYYFIMYWSDKACIAVFFDDTVSKQVFIRLKNFAFLGDR